MEKSTIEQTIKNRIKEATRNQGPRTRLHMDPVLILNVFKELAIAQGKPYELDIKNLKAIEQFLDWMIISDDFEGDPEKGILINGPIGTGKTYAFELLKQATWVLGIRATNWNTIRCQEIASEYEELGWEGIKKYISGNWMFDDLGEEKKDTIHYGTKMNVMQEILGARYHRTRTERILTFATSNYQLQNLGQFYGSRTESRIREMFNILTMSGEDRRK